MTVKISKKISLKLKTPPDELNLRLTPLKVKLLKQAKVIKKSVHTLKIFKSDKRMTIKEKAGVATEIKISVTTL